MKNPKITRSVLLVALISSAAVTHAATIINVNFGAAKTESTLVGPAGGSGTTWNQAGTAKSASNLNDSTNTATTIGWSLSTGLNGAGDWGSGTTEEMLESAFYRSDGGSNTLTISGLDNTKTYNLYIASFDQNNWANTPMSFSTTNTTTTVGAQVASNTLGSPWTLNNNYVLFEDLEPNSGQIAIAGARTEGIYSFWNGFQLVAVPEPSTLLSFSLAGLLLLRRRR